MLLWPIVGLKLLPLLLLLAPHCAEAVDAASIATTGAIS
jgi:hypothetical protein